MAAQDPTIRRLSAIKAIHTKHARMSPAERAAATEAARAAYTRQLEDQVDPERKLDPEDRAVRVSFLRKAKLAEMSLKAAKARQARRDAEAAAEVDALLSAEAGVA